MKEEKTNKQKQNKCDWRGQEVRGLFCTTDAPELFYKTKSNRTQIINQKQQQKQKQAREQTSTYAYICTHIQTINN